MICAVPVATAALTVGLPAISPGDSAIGLWVESTGPYAVPLFGGVVSHSLFSETGEVVVTVGRLLMSAAVSDSRMRKLTLLKYRDARRSGFTESSFAPGRRIKSALAPPAVNNGRSRRRAPVAVLRM